MAGTARLGTWVIPVPTVPGIPCARYSLCQALGHMKEAFFRSWQGEKTPGFSRDEEGAPRLNCIKPLMEISWNSRNLGILAGLDIAVCWSAEQESESRFLGAGNLC